MLTGRKLLLADDSVAIQKIIDLTFTDEGMEVTTVGDGDQALDRLEEITPDIVLADVFMPGIDGYKLCRIIRQNERLKEIPVILLVGSFEPFNEADARLAGASDVVTKPFQSIRDLVSRVGKLLGKKSEDTQAGHPYSTLGLGRTDERAPEAPVVDSTREPDLKVFVEAPPPDNESMKDTNLNVLVEAASIPEHETPDSTGPTCATDVEVQTADTRKLERIDDEEAGMTTEPSLYAQDDTIEIEPVMDVEKMDAAAAVATVTEQRWFGDGAVKTAPQQTTPPESSDMFGDTLLDIGEFDNATARAVGEDLVLDLDFEEPLPLSDTWQESVVGSTSIAAKGLVTGSPTEVVASGVAVAEALPGSLSETEPSPPTVQTANLNDLSPETIEAIAHRVVEQMSEKVVREIAWEVVPDLAELLIKQKLEEQK